MYPSLPASDTPAGAMRGAVLAGALWPMPGAGGGAARPFPAWRGAGAASRSAGLPGF